MSDEHKMEIVMDGKNSLNLSDGSSLFPASAKDIQQQEIIERISTTVLTEPTVEHAVAAFRKAVPAEMANEQHQGYTDISHMLTQARGETVINEDGPVPAVRQKRQFVAAYHKLQNALDKALHKHGVEVKLESGKSDNLPAKAFEDSVMMTVLKLEEAVHPEIAPKTPPKKPGSRLLSS